MNTLLPTKDQLPFLHAQAQVVGFCGERGRGKSTALLLDGFAWCGESGQPHPALMVSRRAQGLLEQASTLSHNLQQPRPEVLREPAKRWLSWPASGSWMLFDSLQSQDALRGWEFDCIGIDDLEDFGVNDLLFLLNRLRPLQETRLRVTFSPLESWVHHFFAPWFPKQDETTSAYVCPAASGEIRFFVQQGAGIRWLEPGEQTEQAISATVIHSGVSEGRKEYVDAS